MIIGDFDVVLNRQEYSGGVGGGNFSMVFIKEFSCIVNKFDLTDPPFLEGDGLGPNSSPSYSRINWFIVSISFQAQMWWLTQKLLQCTTLYHFPSIWILMTSSGVLVRLDLIISGCQCISLIIE